jgi:hypothetical protein
MKTAYRSGVFGVTEPEHRPRKQIRVIFPALAVVVAAGAVWAGYAGWSAFQGRNSPSCSWPLRIRGTANSAQSGVVRCYLQALAKRDTAGLRAVADDDPAVRLTAADLTHSADARAGLATATFTPSPVDDTYVLLTIAFADGRSEKTGIMNMTAMGGPSAWRVQIGTVINPGP